ncbi:MAG: hypothetical protein ACKOCD_02185 [Nitrospiraceae bacterium]
MSIGSRDPNLEIRLQRAKSWLALSEKLEELHRESFPQWARDHELFIFNWIAFNALYGRNPWDKLKGTKRDDEDSRKPPEGEWVNIEPFLVKVSRMSKTVEAEGDKDFIEAVKKSWRYGKQVILDHFLDRAYWTKAKHLDDVQKDCRDRYQEAEEQYNSATESFEKFLKYSFKNLLVLRNQILHGSASHGSGSKGKDSLKNGLEFSRIMIPAIYSLIDSCGDKEKWEMAPYPRLGWPGHPWKSPLKIL